MKNWGWEEVNVEEDDLGIDGRKAGDFEIDDWLKDSTVGEKSVYIIGLEMVPYVCEGRAWIFEELLGWKKARWQPHWASKSTDRDV